MGVNEVLEKFRENPSMSGYGAGKLAKSFNTDKLTVQKARELFTSEIRGLFSKKSISRNVLVIGDLHLPFEKDGYFEFCLEQYVKWGCNHVVFIGDIVDNHYSSYHETDPDGMSATDELEFTISKLKKWVNVFPSADVVIGNHDAIITRKAFSSGISKKWIKDYGDVLEAPDWNFDLNFEYDNVIYTHGLGGGGINGALTKALNKRKSIVQGHWHTEAHVRWNVSDYDRLFSMQVGCGIDDKSYAMAYAKENTKKSIIGCGVILDNGSQPISILMDL